MIARLFAICLAALAIALVAFADEQINRYDVVIDVETDGDIIVTETIDIRVEGRNVKRGINRDLVKYFRQDGAKYAFDYKILSITRDGKREPYERMSEGNAVRLRIGDADVFLPFEDHVYEIRYRVKNQIRYFDEFDELYWNPTGSYWTFPILSASATVNLPNGSRFVQQSGYTGPQGSTDTNYRFVQDGDTYIFQTTQSLDTFEGLSVSLSFEKGLIDPPSGSDIRSLWWQRYGSLALLILSGLGLFGYYGRAFNKVGRDPPKLPIFARYEPPEGYSPAATHHIYHRGFSGDEALISSLMNIAIKKRIKISVSEAGNTTLTRQEASNNAPALSADEDVLLARILGDKSKLTLGEAYSSKFATGYNAFKRRIGKTYGADYFKWNRGYALFGIPITIAIAVYVVANTLNWTVWHTAGLLGLAAMNALFLYLLPAPTRKGAKIRSEIEGFRLYLKTAEELHLNSVEVGGDRPLPMTTERYEKFLPYAIALGVEKPWTKHFESLLPDESKAYDPAWTNQRKFGSIGKRNESIYKSIGSSVSTASTPPQSSSSSGSGGGGFSGGGGGGGGGSGW